MISEALRNRFYGSAEYDGSRLFYSLVRSTATSASVVLDLGAGPCTRDGSGSLRGTVAKVVGADVDAAVLNNPDVDEPVLIDGRTLPFADATFDLAFSDYVLEHVEDPRAFLGEVHRVLKPGASFWFRTPNVNHYVAFVSRLTPHWFHERTANAARGLGGDAHAPWPTFYRLNSRRAIRRAAREAGFSEWDFRMVECEPSYLCFHVLPFLMGLGYERFVNSSAIFEAFRANIFGRLTKSALVAGGPGGCSVPREEASSRK